jgi:type 2 lantibiotic biosynthesis protein LanM
VANRKPEFSSHAGNFPEDVIRDIAPRAHPLHSRMRNQEHSNAIEHADLDSLPRELYEEWLEAVAPGEPEQLLKRLRWSGITPEDLKLWAPSSSPSPDHGNSATRSDWRYGVSQICAALMEHWDDPLLRYQQNHHVVQIPFIDLWSPAVEHGLAALRDRRNNSSDTLHITDSAYKAIGQTLLKRLAHVGEQLLWSEFKNSSAPGDILLAHLGYPSGGSKPPSRNRYRRFVRTHRRDGLSSLIRKYPVFGRLIGTVWLLWLETATTMLDRISKDAHILEEYFGIPSDAALCQVDQGLSDPHRGGQTVAILSFRIRRKTHKVVYKPKDMSLDETYQGLIKHINDHSQQAALKTITIYSGRGYGYAEHITHRLCCDKRQRETFYHNAGRLTAVLYILGCTDCHYENLIAVRDQLVLIDTETLFEGGFSHSLQANNESLTDSSISPIHERFRDSVLRSGILPIWIFFNNGRVAMDVSALGVAPPPTDMQFIRGWLGLNSDGMLPGRILRRLDLPTSLPVGPGTENPLNDYAEKFCEGFANQCEELIHLKKELIGPNGWLDHFSGLTRRTLFRATRVYFLIQQQQLQPEALGSSVRQAMKLEQLARSFLLHAERPDHWDMLSDELRQMEQLDIPVFTELISYSHSDSAADSSNTKPPVWGNGLNASRSRIAELDRETIAFQLRLIKGSCEARVTRDSQEESASTEHLVEPSLPAPVLPATDHLLEAATVMQSLVDLSIRDNRNNIDWLGLGLGADGERFTFGPVGLSLYGGSTGVALLAARMIRLSDNHYLPLGREELDGMVHDVIKPLAELAQKDKQDWCVRLWRDQGLGLNGCGGILLFLLGLEHEQWQSSSHSPRELLESLLLGAQSGFIGKDRGLDIIGGCAGLIGPLLHLGTPKALELAVLAGERLLETQAKEGGWVSLASEQKTMLLGFSHGAAGFVSALAALHRATNDPRFLKGADKALTFERARFDKQACNWPDYRQNHRDHPHHPSSAGLRFMTSWCHGAPGIALARTSLWDTALWDDKAAEEVQTALNTTGAMAMLRNDHLCCGALGIAAILRYAGTGPWISDGSARRQWLERANAVVDQSIARRNLNGKVFLCLNAQQGSLLLPGMFNGLSGMGMVLSETRVSASFLPQILGSGLFPSLTDESSDTAYTN